VAHREHRKLHAPAAEEAIAGVEQGIGPLAPKTREGRLDFAAGVGVEHLNLQSEGACGFRYISQRGPGGRSVCRIDQHGNPNGLGHQVVQEPSRLATNSEVKVLMPVALPPGRARLPTKPSLTGSSATPKMIGIVVVAALAASDGGLLPGVAITATRRRTRSAISDGRRSYWPASQWYSTVTF
jgi:hypothetical protein